MAPPWTWIFQAAPKGWNLREALAVEPRLAWKVTHYRKDINVGDTVYMWESGSRAALLARCTVSSKPRMQPANPRYARYVEDAKYLEEMVRAGLTIEQVFRQPIPRAELLEYPMLSALLPIGGVAAARQGTNFSVRPDQAVVLHQITSSR